MRPPVTAVAQEDLVGVVAAIAHDAIVPPVVLLLVGTLSGFVALALALVVTLADVGKLVALLALVHGDAPQHRPAHLIRHQHLHKRHAVQRARRLHPRPRLDARKVEHVHLGALDHAQVLGCGAAVVLTAQLDKADRADKQPRVSWQNR